MHARNLIPEFTPGGFPTFPLALLILTRVHSKPNAGMQVLAAGVSPNGGRWGVGPVKAFATRSWLILALVALAPGPAAWGGYKVVDLGVIPGGGSSSAAGINQSGEVAGSGSTGGAFTHAFFTNGGGSLSDLGTLPGGLSSHGAAINDGGTVVGTGTTSADGVVFASHAFVAAGGGGLRDLGVLPGATASYGTGVNDGGRVVGDLSFAGGVTHAFLTDGAGKLTDLGTGGGTGSVANGVNNGGTVVGTLSAPGGFSVAFRGTAGGLAPILTPGGGSSTGLAINDGGQVVGALGFAGGSHAYRTTAGGLAVDLGSLAGAPDSVADAINRLGQVVGSASFGAGLSHAFLYTDAQGMVDLNSALNGGAGWVLGTATGINDRGQITGTGTFQGMTRAYRLDPFDAPVPEPPAVILCGIGLCTGAAAVWLRPRLRLKPARIADPAAA